MGRLLGFIIVLGAVAFAGAAAQSWYRMKDGPTVVDSIVEKFAGGEGAMEKAGRAADRLLDKARDAVKSD